MILAAAMVCGMMAANVSCVSAKGSDEGKVINIYSWNDESVRDWKLFIRK